MQHEKEFKRGMKDALDKAVEDNKNKKLKLNTLIDQPVESKSVSGQVEPIKEQDPTPDAIICPEEQM